MSSDFARAADHHRRLSFHLKNPTVSILRTLVGEPVFLQHVFHLNRLSSGWQNPLAFRERSLQELMGKLFKLTLADAEYPINNGFHPCVSSYCDRLTRTLTPMEGTSKMLVDPMLIF